ncbi:NAD-dependent epimerase/dehydratase family protein [Streptomyces sp. Z26]|uniref:NAD-dependent epimerase/dehydratase family protein n=1 Tax=Streptomyces sp. Z26 TaxID=2500177 RepID=UPI000EF135F4|nr:NAD-dependent epimerase/dehydratase family protein [Streptomyces sp. Z26]RLL68022.1 NAD-dependent epimerase/dehydratase family protein [Streptomyces sp. Z26]
MRVLVTGASGFLGGAVCARLAAAGHEVHGLSRTPHALPDALAVRQHLADVRDADAVAAAVSGCDAVVHCAARAGLWGPPDEFRSVNVTGTRNVVAACLHHGVPRLVHTSTPSVVFGGGDLAGVDESHPYPRRHTTPYARSKAVAERLVLAADPARLGTVALRPHLVWGPGDPHFLPRIVRRARGGLLRLPGGGRKLTDTVYVDDAADAHVRALALLAPGAPPAGRAYFVSQGEPRTVRDCLNSLLAAAGLPPVERSVPPVLVRAAGAVLEPAHRVLRLPGEPVVTRGLVDYLCTAHWFDVSAARRDLGHVPEVSTEEGLRRTAEAYARARGRARGAAYGTGRGTAYGRATGTR